MKNTTLLNQIYNLSLQIFNIYNAAIRTPQNWKEERLRLKANPSSRALWRYKIPKNIDILIEQLTHLKIKTEKEIRYTNDIYGLFLLDVIESTFRTANIKLKILKDLQNQEFESSVYLREQFFNLKFDYKNIEEKYRSLLGKKTITDTGRQLSEDDIPSSEAVSLVKNSIALVKEKVAEAISFPKNIEKIILNNFNAKIEIVDDPSFSMRCITDPKSLAIKVLLNKNRKYSKSLLKIAVLHEFAGHALEMVVFDKTLIKNRLIPNIYGYAGVSSPNIFDIKAEVFADMMVEPFITKDEMKYVRYRRDVWLTCRAMADYLYHIKRKALNDVMEVYNAVGLSNFAFDEVIMASIFIDGYQGMYLFANEEIEKLESKFKSKMDFLTCLLFMGKIPINKIGAFQKLYRQRELSEYVYNKL